MRRLLALLLILLTLLSLTACGERQEILPEESTEAAEQTQPAEATLPQPEIIDPVEVRLDALMAEMTLAERVGQLFFVRMPLETEVADVSGYHLGGYVVFWRNIRYKSAAELADLLAACQAEAKIPLFMGTDEEGGSVVRVSLNSLIRQAPFSSPRYIYNMGGLDALRADSAEKDALLKSVGINVNLAPVADCATDQSAFIYDRTVGSSPTEAAQCVRTMVEQMRADGMGSCLKHFPGYGNNVDTHSAIAEDTRPYEQFVAEDFIPFQAGIDAGAPFVLVSHNIIDCMDPTLPASLSPRVHEVLRQELGFEGLIVTDDLTMAAVAAYVENGSAAVQALLAGNDMIITTDYPTQIEQVLDAVADGSLPTEIVDSACRRVLRVKMEMRLM